MDKLSEAQIQSEHDRAEIKIKVIENGLIVKTGLGWFAYEDDEKAFANVRARIKALRAKRTGAA